MSLFVDSSVWYAAADRADRSHAHAKAILSKAERGVTTDHVLVETWLLLHHRLGKHAAERFWGGLKSGVAAIESVTAADLEVAWAIGERFPDQDFSIVDRTSFAVMHRLGIRQVSAFDDDFAVYRYGRDRVRLRRGALSGRGVTARVLIVTREPSGVGSGTVESHGLHYLSLSPSTADGKRKSAVTGAKPLEVDRDSGKVPGAAGDLAGKSSILAKDI